MAVFDDRKNNAISNVLTAPSPATSGTSLVVLGGEGARFPTVPFNATVGPPNVILTPANSEIVRVTARSTDTLTITRAQEGSTARSIAVADVIYAGPTDKTFDDIETPLNQAITDIAGIAPLGYGVWTSYTPTLTQSGTVTKTVTYARYTRFGKTVIVQFSLAVTGAGTASNVVTVSLPVAGVSNGSAPTGVFYILDASASTQYSGNSYYVGSVMAGQAGGVSTNDLGASVFTAALASGDSVRGYLIYEAA